MVNVADCPGNTETACCAEDIEKFGLAGSAVIMRVGGLGSVFPVLSMAVIDVTNDPALPKVTAPGFGTAAEAGEPPGNTHPYFVAVALEPLKETAPPAVILTSELGDVMLPLGG